MATNNPAGADRRQQLDESQRQAGDLIRHMIDLLDKEMRRHAASESARASDKVAYDKLIADKDQLLNETSNKVKELEKMEEGYKSKIAELEKTNQGLKHSQQNEANKLKTMTDNFENTEESMRSLQTQVSLNEGKWQKTIAGKEQEIKHLESECSKYKHGHDNFKSLRATIASMANDMPKNV